MTEEYAEIKKKEKAAFQRLFASEDGEIVLSYLSRTCFENRPTYVPGDTHESAFREGVRGVILRIRSLLKEEKPKQEKASGRASRSRK